MPHREVGYFGVPTPVENPKSALEARVSAVTASSSRIHHAMGIDANKCSTPFGFFNHRPAICAEVASG